jgi:hypothetical protein
MKRAAISLALVHELLDYNPVTGVFRWKRSPAQSVKAGDIAGYDGGNGYRKITIMGRHFRAHHLAWAMVQGEFPAGVIDHINGIRDDNRIVNLRLATRSQNSQNRRCHRNSRTGLKGVSWRTRERRWQAHIRVAGKLLHLGYFHTPEQAHAAYVAAATKYFGEFARAA